jgi:hypothetical protein
VVVRTLTREGETYIYLVNDSDWPVSVQVDLDGPADCRIKPLSQRRPAPPLTRGTSGLHWVVELEPYDLLAGVLTAPDVTVTRSSVQLPPDVVPSLQEQIAQAGARVARLADPPPLRALKNPGFEVPCDTSEIPGWIVATGTGVSAHVDSTRAHEGGDYALRLESSGPVAKMRSETFAVPETGRVSLTAWLRCQNSERPPKVRLVIEGQVAGGAFHRWPATVGSDPKSGLRTAWRPFILSLTDLPIRQLENLRVGFDLIGPGTVWIDDVQLSDLPFDRVERRELEKIVARSYYQWRDEQYGDCARGLNEYWPRFLRQHVPLPSQRMATVPTPQAPSTPSGSSEDTGKPSVLDRMKRWLPRVPRF